MYKCTDGNSYVFESLLHVISLVLGYVNVYRQNSIPWR